MSERRNRRPFWTALVLTAAAVVPMALLSILAARERSAALALLAEHVANNEPQQAANVMQRLATLPDPPVDALVIAARCPDRAISDPARQVIGDLLQACAEAIDARQRTHRVAHLLVQLAASLARQQKSFSAADQPWLAETTHTLLRLANRLPPGAAPNLAMRCDALLASVELVEMSNTAFAPRAEPPRSIPDAASADTAPRAPNAISAMTTPGNNLRTDSQSVSPGNAAANPIRPQQSPDTRWRPENSEWPQSGAGPQDAAAEPAALPHSANVASQGGPKVPPTGSPAAPALAEFATRQLFAEWLAATDVNRVAIELELVRRGFGRLSNPWVSQLLSDQPQHRLQLLDAVLREPGVDARPWLVLLAEDASADVRLSAITVMATSNEPSLLEKALAVALRDRDPRIADLAGRLHQRLSLTTGGRGEPRRR